MDVEEDLKELSEEELQREEGEGRIAKLVKRLIIALIGVFLIFLMFSYLVPGSYTISILEGLLVSSKLNNYTAPFSGGTVYFNEEVYGELKGIYFENQRNEFKVCLGGEKQGDNYFINSIYVPRIIQQTYNSVTAEQCNSTTLIPLHKHPYRRCIFSSQDLRSYDAFKRINDEAIIGLMCEAERFTFYGSER